jgi:hypothetical protein
MPALAEHTMVRRDDATAKLDADLVRKAKIVAAYRDVSLAEYLSEALRPIVESDHREHARHALDEQKPGKPKGKG